MHRPKITTNRRNNNIAIYVSMPGGDRFNVWDLAPEECSDDVLKAIKHAFELGVMTARKMVSATFEDILSPEIKRRESSR